MKQHEQTIRALLERYDEGLTTDEEERALRRLLAEEEQLPHDLQAAAALFAGFDALAEEQMPVRVRRTPLRRHAHRIAWAVAAAVVVGVVLLADHLATPYCYINGEPIRDRSVALASTEYLAQLETVEQSFELLDQLILTDNN